ncbi:hypothetical protein KR51_00016850 [Rubidibacter lacunae KORDI 51-2]|uniref:Uncharacterized protein n=1 Tax=Rubidibacter lacunae KORDI 51-2 TaxID=582515 RepID=U5DAW9_9CHRO|nr:hypothetical protein [Rubidibacter lacunae]ERN41693.1 hypothetical protein KR51_00016850 [Rubidibacter lacunae KORDI 51-2]
MDLDLAFPVKSATIAQTIAHQGFQGLCDTQQAGAIEIAQLDNKAFERFQDLPILLAKK